MLAREGTRLSADTMAPAGPRSNGGASAHGCVRREPARPFPALTGAVASPAPSPHPRSVPGSWSLPGPRPGSSCSPSSASRTLSSLAEAALKLLRLSCPRSQDPAAEPSLPVGSGFSEATLFRERKGDLKGTDVPAINLDVLECNLGELRCIPVPRHVPGGRVLLPPPRPARLDTFLSTDVLFAFLPVYCSAAIQRLLCGRKGKRGTKARNQPHGREMVMRAREGKRRRPARLCRRRSVCRRLGLRAAPGERAGAGVQQPSRERSEPPWALPAERPSGIRGEPPTRTRDVKLRVIEGSGSCVCPGRGVGTAQFIPLLCTGADPPHTCAPETQPGEGALPPPRGLQPEPPTRSRSSKVWMRIGGQGRQ